MNTSMLDIPLAKIRPSPYQARKDFDAEGLQDLADSMREQGLIEPIVVRAISDVGVGNSNLKERRQSTVHSNPRSEVRNPKFSYELISGERRFRAAKNLKWKTIPAVVMAAVSDVDAAVKGLIENLQREDLNPIEEAEGFAALQKLDKKKWTQKAIAKAIGKKQSYVSQALGFLELPEPIRQNIRRRIFSRNHGVELVRLPTPEWQSQVAAQIKDNLTVHETRRLIDSILKADKPAAVPPPRPVAAADIDPLSVLWSLIRPRFQIPAGIQWSVGYPIPGQWAFLVTADPAKAVSSLRAWAAELARQLGQEDAVALESQPALSALHQDLAAQLLNTNPEELEETDNIDNARLPKTQEDWGELDEAIIRGPSAVYRWIYGPKSRIAKSMESKTWGDLGVDPKTYAVDLVKSLKK